MIASVPDVIFVVLGYGVILGAITAYAVTLVRRLRQAQGAAGREDPAEDR